MKEYNVLILDDIKLVGVNIRQRISDVAENYFSLSGIRIIPHYDENEEIDITDIDKLSKKIEYDIVSKKIDYLLLDKGFTEVIESIDGFEETFLYAKNREWVTIDKILEKIHIEKHNRIKGIIIYTYNPEEKPNFPEEKADMRNKYLKILPKKFKRDYNFQIFMSNSEVYKKAELKLYDQKSVSTEYIQLGLKADFKLYGLFMGEILYHRVVSIINQKEKQNLRQKKRLVFSNIFILFFVLTGLSIGGNALYDILTNNNMDIFLLFVLSIIFSILMPLFILLIKPELLISLIPNNEDN